MKNSTPTPFISIIIPVYNAEKYIGGCLDCLLAQTIDINHLEVICINDGSEDNSEKIIKTYEDKFKYFILEKQKNHGLSFSRNKGIDLARGEYIFFLDADDYLHPQCLELLYSHLKQNNACLIYCNYQQTNNSFTEQKEKGFPRYLPDCKQYNLPLYRFLTKKIPVSVWNKLYKKDLLKDIRFINDIYFEDIYFTTLLLNKIDNVLYLDVPLYYYFQSPVSITRSSFSQKKIDSYIITLKTFADKSVLFGKNYLHIKEKLFPQIIKIMLKQTFKQHNPDLLAYLQQKLRDLYKKQIIGYQGLGFFYKIKLFYLLNWKK